MWQPHCGALVSTRGLFCPFTQCCVQHKKNASEYCSPVQALQFCQVPSSARWCNSGNGMGACSCMLSRGGWGHSGQQLVSWTRFWAFFLLTGLMTPSTPAVNSASDCSCSQPIPLLSPIPLTLPPALSSCCFNDLPGSVNLPISRPPMPTVSQPIMAFNQNPNCKWLIRLAP